MQDPLHFEFEQSTTRLLCIFCSFVFVFVGMSNIVRIPILRGKIQQTRFDLSLGTLCGLWNTTFLHHCAENDPLVVPLCSCVATWSKIQGAPCSVSL